MITETGVHERIKEIFSSVFGDMEISIDSSMKEVTQWDSLAHVKIIMEIENSLATRLPLDEALTLNSVRKIQEYLHDRGHLK